MARCRYCNKEMPDKEVFFLRVFHKNTKREPTDSVFCSSHCMLSYCCLGLFSSRRKILFDYFGIEDVPTVFTRGNTIIGIMEERSERKYHMLMDKDSIEFYTESII